MLDLSRPLKHFERTMVVFRKVLSVCLISILLLSKTSCHHARPSAEPLDVPPVVLEEAMEEMRDNPLIDNRHRLPYDWWTLFEDEQLTHFVHQAFANNPTLQIAYANMLMAHYAANNVRSTLFPSINLGADVSRQKLSKTGIVPFMSAPSGGPSPLGVNVPIGVPNTSNSHIPMYFTQYETEFILSYDFDIWNKNRNTWLAAIGETYARRADEAFTRLQLGISVAQVYFRLQIDYKRQDILQTYVQNQARYLELTQQRIKGSIDTELLRKSARANLATAKQMLLQVQGDIAVQENQLKYYLAGNLDEEINSIQVEEKLLPKVPLPEDLPLHLLAQRPDITAQLWLIQSAGKQIEVAKAGFYPDFNIAAILGFQTIHLHDWFKWPSRYFNVDPAVTLPIFDGGRLISNLRGSEVNYDLAILKYNDLVLNAVKEVLDGLAVLRNTEQQFQESKKRLEFQEELFELTNQRLTHNLASGQDYLISEQNMLLAHDQEIVSLGNVIQAILSLIKALGGGYDTCNM